MTQLASKQLTSVLVAAALIIGFAFAFAAPAKADTISDLQAQIATLMAQISGLKGGSTTTSSSACFTFTRNHKNGDKGGEVMEIQKFLNSSSDTQVSAAGAGSPGNETSTFGPATKKAVIKFQEKYASDILSPVGLTKGNGNWYAGTRAKANALCTTAPATGTTGTTGGTTQTPTGTGVTIAAATQPANTLAPKGASRVPFTTFTLTNTTGAAVTINGITVQRTGLAHDAAFAGVVLLDQNGLQVGISHTFNSNHQSTIGDTFTLAAGQSMTYTVAGNMATDLTSYTGEVASISVVSVNTSVPVSGTLPISGAQQTLNNTLAVGTVATSTSSYDPGAAQTKSIGDTAVRFSGIRFTAGSAEDVKLFNLRWRQTGTASNSDLSNIVTVVNGTSYPTVLDASGKYYTTTFTGGLLIAKGNSVDVYVQGDITGSGAASRTVEMDIDKQTDVYFVGQLYGYGVTAGTTAYTPWFVGKVTTIQGGSYTTISNATEVAAQNIAVNVQNQPLGGFVTDFKGEAVNVTSLAVTLATSTMNSLITQVTLVDDKGVTVAGPVDATAVSLTGGQTVTFTDSITFPVGRKVYTIKGKIPSGTASNVTVIASTIPSGWGGRTGQVTGNTISISQGTFSMNTMTVRAGSLAIGLSTTPGSQNIVGTGSGILFANVQLDASQSGEDVRISGVPVRIQNNIAGLSSCQLFDGTTALNTGSNVPTSLSTTTVNTFTFDNSLIVPKGTVKTLAFKCNLNAGSGPYAFFLGDPSTHAIDTISVTGQTSGSTVTATQGNYTGGTMTVAGGALAVTLDSASPSYAVATAGSTGVILGSYKFHATNEAVNLTRVGLVMSSATASSTAADLNQVTLWANGVQIGTATFVGTDTHATSTALTNVQVPKDGDLIVTVKGDLAVQGSSASSHPGALIVVNVDANSTGNTSGTGANSGATVDASGTTSVAGVRVFKSYPTFAKLTPQSTTLVAQGGVELYRFSVTANAAGDIALDKLVVNVATSSYSSTNGTTSVTNVNVYGYTDSALSNAVSGFTSGLIATVNSGGGVASGNNTATFSNVLSIPAGQTRWFKVVGDVAQEAGSSGSAGSVTTKIVGDSAYPALSTLMGTVSGVSTSNLIWSPLSTTTTAATANIDWTNGYQIPGLPSAGTDSVTLSK
jgi:hypothetical protein